MPVYEYECENCSHRFEEIQGFSDEPLKKCPSCKKMKLRRLFGSPGLVFKGPGFHVNDYPKDEK